MATLRVWQGGSGSPNFTGVVQCYRKTWDHAAFDFSTGGTPPELLLANNWSVYGVNVLAADLLDEVTLDASTNDANDLIEFEVPDGEGDFLIVTKAAFVDLAAPAAGQHPLVNLRGFDVQTTPDMSPELEQSGGALSKMKTEPTKNAQLGNEQPTYAGAIAGPAEFANIYGTSMSTGQEFNGAQYNVVQVLLHFPFDERGGEEHADVAPGTPAHFIVNREGGAAYPVIAEWESRGQANGGWVGETGRVAGALIREKPDVFTDGADWFTVVKETGDLMFSSTLKRPPITDGVVDLSGDGPASLANREIEHLFYGEFGPREWTVEDDEVFRTEPTEAPKTGAVTTGQATGLGGGAYRWAVTFVTSAGESGLGPYVELELDPLGALQYHVEIRDIPRGNKHVTARRLFRLNPTGTAYQLVTQINDNTTETFTDTLADGALGANGPRAKQTTQIAAEVKKGSMVFTVPADAFVLESEVAGFVRWPSQADLSSLVIVADCNRDLPNWELLVLSGEGPNGSTTEELVQGLTNVGESFRLVVPITDTNADQVKIRLHRIANGQDNDPVKVSIRVVKLYGIAKDDDFYADDLVRDVAVRLGCDDHEHVHSSDVPILPAVFQGGTFKDPLDTAATLTLWRWLIYRRNLRLVMDFRPYGGAQLAGAQEGNLWRLTEEATVDLLPEPRYNRVRIPYKWQNGVASDYAEAIADPNPLDHIETAPPLDMEKPGSQERAERMAQVYADFYASDRWSGEVEFSRVQDEHGLLWSHTYVKEGDKLFVPSIGAALNIDTLARKQATSRAAFPEGIFPALERFNERRRRTTGL